MFGTIHGAGRGPGNDQNAGATGRGKDAPRKSHKADFPCELGNPAPPAGFPLSHRPDGGWLTLKPDMSCATKTGPFNLLQTGASTAWPPIRRENPWTVASGAGFGT